MPQPFFFGYGSLVNRATHDYPQATPARVSGWRRCWRHTSLRPLAYLSVTEAAEGGVIDGLIAAVPQGDWAALDERERAYERQALASGDIEHRQSGNILVHIYRTRAGVEAPVSVRHPVLLSYIDTVVSGFLDLFGEAGVARFFETTDGWDIQVIDDRAAPHYARAVIPNAREIALVDGALEALGVRR